MNSEQKMSVRLTSLQNAQNLNAQRISATKEETPTETIMKDAETIFQYLTQDGEDTISRIKPLVN